MSNTDKEVKIVLSKLLEFIVPEGMSPKERRRLAAQAGISEETLRKNLQRKSLNADTLIRLLLARGVSAKALAAPQQADLSKLSEGEAGWAEFGRKLSEAERTEFVELLKYLRSRWDLLK